MIASPTTRGRPKKTKKSRRARPDLDSISAQLFESGWTEPIVSATIAAVIRLGFTGRNLPLAYAAIEKAREEKPVTLRSLFYRLVSAGLIPSTDQTHYQRVGRIVGKLREGGAMPFSWIVDNTRQNIKPSSWSGLADFAETVSKAYRLNFWERLPTYVHFFCEKDAIAGTLEPVTREFDVTLSPIRGYASLSFAHDIARTWNRIEKPINAYYLGDFDPSGFDLERDVREKLERYCDREFHWERLAVNAEDFSRFDLIPLKPKKSDARYRKFVTEHGSECAEVDAIPSTELRRRVRESIEKLIPREEWERLKQVEAIERESWGSAIEQLKTKTGGG